MYYIALGENTRLLSFNNFLKAPTHEFIKKTTPYFIQLNIGKTEISKLKSKIKKVISHVLTDNHYKTSYKSKDPMSRTKTAHFEVDTFSIHYIAKTHFVSSYAKPPGVDIKDIRDYTNQISSHLSSLQLDSNKDEVFIVDIELDLSKKPNTMKTGKKVTCKNVKNKYKQYYNYTKKRIKNKMNKSRNIIPNMRRGMRNNNNLVFTNNNNRLTNNTQRRKKQAINRLRKKQSYFNSDRYPREIDYIRNLRKKVQNELTNSE